MVYAHALKREDDSGVATDGGPPSLPRTTALTWLAERWSRIDGPLFLAFASACLGYVGVQFYGAMLHQTDGVWSAPLDDVFIHFDYARATYRGHPFEWCAGNGFSSGNTSMTYPFALALGFLLPACRGLGIMRWAALVAFASMLVFFSAVGRLSSPLGRWAKYVLPPAVLSLGALDWSLASGMENAFHLGVFGLALSGVLAVERGLDDRRAWPRRRAWIAGVACALLVLTRPESIVCVAAFVVFLAVLARKRGLLKMLSLGVSIGGPGALALFAQAAANRVLTGEWSQAGALAKLALYHPYMPPQEKWNDWVFHVTYVFARNLHHHFADVVPYGYLVPALGLVPLFDPKIRRYALLLWSMVLGWLLLVSLNGQVRWQNERYTMAAVAWAFVLAGLGVASLASRYGATLKGRAWWGARLGVAALAIALFWKHQAPNFRDQVWFFARASRNILDQHVTAGKALAKMDPPPRRILVGDAGALMYASDLPGLDIIGLGGYHDYPFARAGRFGLGSTLELIERMPQSERPDVMAIYPTWWGDLPILFGKYLGEFPVYGNVICGGASKVIYKAKWGALDRTGHPRSVSPGEAVVSEVDVADLMSEREQSYTFPHPSAGWVVWHVLADPEDPRDDLFDAGRILHKGERETARIALPRGGGRLIARTAATSKAWVRVLVDDKEVGKLEVKPSDGWAEPSIILPAGLPAEATLTLEPIEGEWTDYHVWVVGL